MIPEAYRKRGPAQPKQTGFRNVNLWRIDMTGITSIFTEREPFTWNDVPRLAEDATFSPTGSEAYDRVVAERVTIGGIDRPAFTVRKVGGAVITVTTG